MKTWLLAMQQQLSRQVRDNKLPHALLFSGVDGAGQKEIAQWLINVLLCQRLKEHVDKTLNKASVLEEINADSAQLVDAVLQPCGICKTCKLFANNSYPDHLTIVSDKKNIGVELIRDLSHFFEKTAHIGDMKTALVNQADTMTVSAANALLKTLEEPTENSFIILTTDSSDLLLPTIISRCHEFEIRPPVGKELLAEFNQQGDDAFVNLSHLSELSDAETAVAFAAFRDMVNKYLFAHQHRADILAILVEHQAGYRWLEKIIVDMMRHQSGWPTVASNNEPTDSINKHQLWDIYNLVQVANGKLKTIVQVNKQFLSEQLLADIKVVLQNNEQTVEE